MDEILLNTSSIIKRYAIQRCFIILTSNKFFVLLLVIIAASFSCGLVQTVEATSAGLFGSYEVQVGYADNLRPSPFFPTPWAGDHSVVFIGSGPMFDAGAVRIVNTGISPITINNVVIDLNRPGPTFNLWVNFTIPVGMSAVLTQTTQYNFDTSDNPLRSCKDTMTKGTAPFPRVSITVNGQMQEFNDSAHVLDTGGWDPGDASCGPLNESLQWRTIGTSGVEDPGGVTKSIDPTPYVAVVVTAAGVATATYVFKHGKDKGKQDWLEIVLVDKNGKPVPGESFKITLPSGEMVNGILGTDGRAHLDLKGIQSGICQVSFPNIADDDWNETSSGSVTS